MFEEHSQNLPRGGQTAAPRMLKRKSVGMFVAAYCCVCSNVPCKKKLEDLSSRCLELALRYAR